ncbi:glycosyltransferase family 4 protein [Staphylococcus gallinarum]|uniref:glycosyltransferase family 4 protein n=1 Tax=Staphylococcus gallinarum TaxID=1293 RepID=UPI001E576442|nr:glycosyltransferase family 4 protein [Staphylococcus gallinarum]MCD8900652.1 glycosyltransferase family 4 protein [Staphylococcus gallinarum]
MKKVWILNHYATDNYFNEGGRHYWISQFLLEKGYDVNIICANTRHNSNDVVNVSKGTFSKSIKSNIPFTFIKSTTYKKNNHKRIFNILSFTLNLLRTNKKLADEIGKPDIILASSVHPLTLVAGLRMAKFWNIPCIVEIRDLWPESIVAYGILSENNVLSKLMYKGEKWIYQKADSIIMTWEGGYDYIKNKGWFNKVNKDKIHHISNGVVLNSFYNNSENYKITDNDLNNKSLKTFVYTGSIRKVNNIELLVKAAKIIQEKNNKSNIKILVYGDGEEKEYLEEMVKNLELFNIEFKGSVPKKYVPYILQHSYVNILHNKSTVLDKYGQSQNKLFEYLAAGNSILQTYTTGYSVIDKYECGQCLEKQSPENIANAILDMADNESRIYNEGQNAKKAAKDFDFEVLTDKLVSLIEK